MMKFHRGNIICVQIYPQYFENYYRYQINCIFGIALEIVYSCTVVYWSTTRNYLVWSVGRPLLGIHITKHFRIVFIRIP